MARAHVQTGMELEYDTFGSPGDPALLLIMGFTAQMISWDEEFCRLLADGGLFVIRFDNRDCGLSSKLDGVEVDSNAVMAAALGGGGEMPSVPYLLSDMAADAMGLLDAIAIERAHIMGASMGGMIAQTVAIEHGHRCLSLISVMSTIGDPNYGAAAPEAMGALLSPSPTDRDEYIASAPQWMTWHSKKYRDEARTKELAAIGYDRSFYPEGSPRQLAAILASGDRTELLAAVTVPTLVIHGRDDTLITPSGGFRTAEVIPGAHLLFMADMGHDMPKPLWPTLTDAIISHTRMSTI